MPSVRPPASYRGTPTRFPVAAGTVLWRVHSRQLASNAFNTVIADVHFGGGRFDSTVSDMFPYLYVAFSKVSALAQTLAREVPFTEGGMRVLPRAAVRERQLSAVELTADVTLLSLLTSEDRAAVGQDGWIVQADPSSYGKTRSWGQWLRAIAPWAQGIAWPSERGLGEPVAVLFGDRIPAQGVQPCLEMATDLDDEKGAAFLNTALATWSLRIRPPRPGKSGLDAPPPSEPGTIPPVPGLIDFDDFFRSSFPVVRRAMWAITQDWTLADDVAQAAMMAAFNSWDVVAEHPEPRGWVIVTARNIAFRVMRKIRKARPDSPAVDRHAPDPAPAGLDPTGEIISRLDLMEALRRLPLRQRECVFLVYLLGYRIKDAASMMGIAEGTVKALLHTARGALRGLLSFDEGDIR